jgi:serine/threonine-protein kinase
VFYYAMELLDGMDLEQVVRQHGPLPSGRAVDVLLQVCGALREAHERGIVHRDIKPANIILCEHGGIPDVAKVVDFGLVKDLRPDAVDATSEAIVGTPSYTAPEMVTDPGSVTAAVDLYALGAVAYFLVSGQRVFEGKTAVDVCIQHVTATPKPLGNVAPGISAQLEDIVMRCLRKQPGERFASAAALADALRDVPASGWTDEAAATWWKIHRGARSCTPSTTQVTETLTIELGGRP